MKKCKMCKDHLVGRSDKIFCCTKCKSAYHYKLNTVTKSYCNIVDSILHRNRSILLEIMGKRTQKLSVNRLLLDEKKFNYDYVTGFYTNSRNKTINYVYDFAWLTFSSSDILIFRKNIKRLY